MKHSMWDYSLPDSFLETQRFLDQLSPALDAWNRIQQQSTFWDNLTGAHSAVASIQQVLDNHFVLDTAARLLDNTAAIRTVLDRVYVPPMTDMTRGVWDVWMGASGGVTMPSLDWDWISQSITAYEDEFSEEEAQDLLTEEVKAELDESVKAILTAENADAKAKSKFLEWQNRHPVLAFLFLQIVLGVIVGLATNVVWNWLTGVVTKKANVYEEATAKSEVVVHVEQNTSLTIVSEVPYYYEVVFTDPESGEEMTGYIYKSHVAMVSPSDEGTPG